MALNILKCNYLTPLHFKGLKFCLCLVISMPIVQNTEICRAPHTSDVSTLCLKKSSHL